MDENCALNDSFSKFSGSSPVKRTPLSCISNLNSEASPGKKNNSYTKSPNVSINEADDSWTERTEIITKTEHQNNKKCAEDMINEIIGKTVDYSEKFANKSAEYRNPKPLKSEETDSDSEYESASELEDTVMMETLKNPHSSPVDSFVSVTNGNGDSNIPDTNNESYVDFVNKEIKGALSLLQSFEKLGVSSPKTIRKSLERSQKDINKTFNPFAAQSELLSPQKPNENSVENVLGDENMLNNSDRSQLSNDVKENVASSKNEASAICELPIDVQDSVTVSEQPQDPIVCELKADNKDNGNVSEQPRDPIVCEVLADIKDNGNVSEQPQDSIVSEVLADIKNNGNVSELPENSIVCEVETDLSNTVADFTINENVSEKRIETAFDNDTIELSREQEKVNPSEQPSRIDEEATHDQPTDEKDSGDYAKQMNSVTNETISGQQTDVFDSMEISQPLQENEKCEQSIDDGEKESNSEQSAHVGGCNQLLEQSGQMTTGKEISFLEQSINFKENENVSEQHTLKLEQQSDVALSENISDNLQRSVNSKKEGDECEQPIDIKSNESASEPIQSIRVVKDDIDDNNKANCLEENDSILKESSAINDIENSSEQLEQTYDIKNVLSNSEHQETIDITNNKENSKLLSNESGNILQEPQDLCTITDTESNSHEMQKPNTCNDTFNASQQQDVKNNANIPEQSKALFVTRDCEEISEQIEQPTDKMFKKPQQTVDDNKISFGQAINDSGSKQREQVNADIENSTEQIQHLTNAQDIGSISEHQEQIDVNGIGNIPEQIKQALDQKDCEKSDQPTDASTVENLSEQLPKEKDLKDKTDFESPINSNIVEEVSESLKQGIDTMSSENISEQSQLTNDAKTNKNIPVEAQSPLEKCINMINDPDFNPFETKSKVCNSPVLKSGNVKQDNITMADITKDFTAPMIQEENEKKDGFADSVFEVKNISTSFCSDSEISVMNKGFLRTQSIECNTVEESTSEQYLSLENQQAPTLRDCEPSKMSLTLEDKCKKNSGFENEDNIHINNSQSSFENILDMLDNPNYNPFETKAKVYNSPASNDSVCQEMKSARKLDVTGIQRECNSSQEAKNINDVSHSAKRKIDFTESLEGKNTSELVENYSAESSETLAINDELESENQTLPSITKESECPSSDNYNIYTKSTVDVLSTLKDFSENINENIDNYDDIFSSNEDDLITTLMKEQEKSFEMHEEEFGAISKEDFEALQDKMKEDQSNKNFRKSLSSVEFDAISKEAVEFTSEVSSILENSIAVDGNSLSAIDDCGEAVESFSDAKSFFDSEEELKYLDGLGKSGLRENLARNSLFVKFDPLVAACMDNDVNSTRLSSLMSFSPCKQATSEKLDYTLSNLSVNNKTVLNDSNSPSPDDTFCGDAETTVLINTESFPSGIQTSSVHCQTEEEVMAVSEYKMQIKELEISYQDILLRKSREIDAVRKELTQNDLKNKDLNRVVQEMPAYLKKMNNVMRDLLQKKNEMEIDYKKQITRLTENHEKECDILRSEIAKQNKTIESDDRFMYELMEKNKAQSERNGKLEEGARNLMKSFKKMAEENVQLSDSVKEMEKKIVVLEESNAKYNEEQVRSRIVLQQMLIKIDSLKEKLAQEEREKKALTKLLDQVKVDFNK